MFSGNNTVSKSWALRPFTRRRRRRSPSLSDRRSPSPSIFDRSSELCPQVRVLLVNHGLYVRLPDVDVDLDVDVDIDVDVDVDVDVVLH